MSKGLEALNKIREGVDTTLWDGNEYDYLDIIEKELKQAEKDKEVLDIFKNALTLKHTCVLPKEQEHSEDVFTYSVMYLYEITQNNLDEKLRKSLREWVLKNAFPKELKALEIIKEKLIDVGRLYGCMIAYPNEKTPIHYNEKIDKRYKTYMLTQEEYDLLKEVML